jgi:hypothetical protein
LLLDQYGAAELQTAILDAIGRDAPHPNAVRIALERQREARRQPPATGGNLPPHVRDRDVAVRPPRLDLYDRLKDLGDDEE